MKPIGKFGLTFGFASVIVIVLSLLWPRLTQKARPQVLGSIRDAVVKTDLGKETANVLGVTKENEVKPFNIQDTAASVAALLIATANDKVKEIVAQQITQQIINQYQQMPSKEQQTLQNLICKQQNQ